jgi:hypothetical protein
MRARCIGSFVLLLASSSSARAVAAEPTKDECIAANETAQSLRDGGNLRAARARLLVCVAKACPGPVRDDCAERITELDKSTPTIVFEVKDARGEDRSAVAVEMDGAPLAPSLDGSALAVDPGEHVFRFSAPGLPSVEKRLVVREGEKARHERVALGEMGPRAVVPPESKSSSGTQRTIGLVAGGAGLAGLVVGSVLGWVAKSTYDDAVRNHCPSGPTSCDPTGVAQGATADHQATASTIAFLAGGALLAGGAVLYFTAPRDGTIAIGPSAYAGGAGVGVRGAW